MLNLEWFLVSTFKSHGELGSYRRLEHKNICLKGLKPPTNQPTNQPVKFYVHPNAWFSIFPGDYSHLISKNCQNGSRLISKHFDNIDMTTWRKKGMIYDDFSEPISSCPSCCFRCRRSSRCRCDRSCSSSRLGWESCSGSWRMETGHLKSHKTIKCSRQLMEQMKTISKFNNFLTIDILQYFT